MWLFLLGLLTMPLGPVPTWAADTDLLNRACGPGSSPVGLGNMPILPNVMIEDKMRWTP